MILGLQKLILGLQKLCLGYRKWFWGCRNWFWGCRNCFGGYRNWFGVTEIDFRVVGIDFGVTEIDFGVIGIDLELQKLIWGYRNWIWGCRDRVWGYRGHSLACSKLHRAPRLMAGLPSLPLNSTALLDTQVSPTFGARVVGLQVSRPSLLHYSRWHSLDSCSYSLESLTIWISPTLPPLCYSILSTPLSRLAAFSQLAQILPGVSPLKYWKKYTSSCVTTCIWHAHADTSSGKKMRKRCG